MEREIYQNDVLVIGSGGAGCRAAIEARQHGRDVIIVSKGLSFKSGCTTLAEGGYNAAFAYVDEEDSTEAHFQDTLRGGGYLNDRELAKILVEEAPDRLNELEGFGAIFDRQESGLLNNDHLVANLSPHLFSGGSHRSRNVTALQEEVIREDIQTIGEVMITPPQGWKGPGGRGMWIFTPKHRSDLLKLHHNFSYRWGGMALPCNLQCPQKTGDGYALAYRPEQICWTWNKCSFILQACCILIHGGGCWLPKQFEEKADG